MNRIRHLARFAAGLVRGQLVPAFDRRCTGTGRRRIWALLACCAALLFGSPFSSLAAYLDASGLLVSQWQNAPFIDSFLDPAAPSNATLAASVVLGNGGRLDSVAVVLCPAGTNGAPGAGSLGHLRWGLWLSAPEDFAAARPCPADGMPPSATPPGPVRLTSAARAPNLSPSLP